MSLKILECPLCEKLYPATNESVCPHCIREKSNYQTLSEIERNEKSQVSPAF